jgi:hypothetical protein
LVPINPKFKNEVSEREANYFWRYGVNGYEITQNGIVISLSAIDAGSMEYSYKARVVNAGTYAVPPATAQLMYNPEVFGRTRAEKVTVGTEATFDPLLAARLSSWDKTEAGENQAGAKTTKRWFVWQDLLGMAIVLGYFAGVVWYKKKHGQSKLN